MTKKTFFLIVCLLLSTFFLVCCAKRPPLPPPTPADIPVSNIKIRVMDVSNETHELYDVDVIGMMWSALEDSLRKRGMLWAPQTAGPPLTIEAHVLKYQEGSAWYRWILPPWGKTVLTTKCDLKDSGQVIASAESNKAITFGHKTFTIGAWRKIFAEVAEDLVSQLTRKL